MLDGRDVLEEVLCRELGIKVMGGAKVIDVVGALQGR